MADSVAEQTPDERESELQIEVELLYEENERLREEHARTRQITYRRTALALAGVGLSAVALGAVLPGVRDILFVTGFIGLFGAVLTWFLTPERVLTIDVSESIYSAATANAVGIRDELGLQPTSVYVPSDDGAHLFIPQHREFELPEDPTTMFISDDDASRGVSLVPTGADLVAEFQRTRTAPAPSDLEAAATQVGNAVVEQFEIAEGVLVEHDQGDNRVVVSIDGAAFGPVTNLDHPVVSVIACGSVRALDDPILVKPIDETTVIISRLVDGEED